MHVQSKPSTCCFRSVGRSDKAVRCAAGSSLRPEAQVRPQTVEQIPASSPVWWPACSQMGIDTGAKNPLSNFRIGPSSTIVFVPTRPCSTTWGGLVTSCTWAQQTFVACYHSTCSSNNNRRGFSALGIAASHLSLRGREYVVICA